MSEKIRVGLIGAGRIGQVHAASIAENHDVEFTYIADVFVDGAQKLADRYGTAVTADPLELINADNVDAVVVCSPTSTHVDLISASIDAGVHVMCEKPIDLDIQRVNALLEKVNASKTQIALGFNRRFDPNFASINSRVKSGEIGNLEQLIIISRDPAPAPKEYIEVSGGIFRDMTIHDFDMARFFVPEIVEVTARGANSFSDYIKEVGDFDSVNVVMRGSNNELITIVNSRHASYGYDQRIEAFGSLGMLTASNQLPTTVRAYSATQTEVADPYLNFFLERYSVAYRQELADFIAGIKNGTNTNPTYKDGRQALILADAALESALTGKSISL